MKITLFWLAGSGTTTIAKLLCEHKNLHFMSTGNIFRQYAQEAGMDLYTFENTVAKHDKNFDLKLDEQVAQYWKNNTNFVFESRLAWHFIPESFKIYLDCTQEERYKRIHAREKGDIKDIAFFNTRRENELIKRYTEVYPDIQFPPSQKHFDLYIDGTKLSPQEILDIILQHI